MTKYRFLNRLWSILEDMTGAFLVLQYGGVEPDEADADGEPIIHRDIKLDNVMLDAPSTSQDFPHYPECRLGDFGVAVITDERDPNNPMSFNDGMGTPRWQAPEQMMYLRKDDWLPMEGEKLGEKTNVWGIGAVLIRLMMREDNPRGPNFDLYGEDFRMLDDDKTGDAYCNELCELVEDCVSYKPAERSTLRDMMARIKAFTTSGVRRT